MGKYYKNVGLLRLRHEFYTGGILPHARIEPLTDTQNKLRNFRMVFKKKGPDYVLLQEADLGNGMATIPLSEDGIGLGFGVRLGDDQFQLRCGLHYDPRRMSIAVHSEAGENKRISGEDILPRRTGLPAGEPGDVPVKDAAGNDVMAAGLMTQAAFNDLVPGIYSFGGPRFLKPNNGPGYDAYLFITVKASQEPPETTFALPAGSYHWRFHIQKKYSRPEALALVDENELIGFGTETTSGVVSTFLSVDPVRLEEQNRTSLVLSNNGNIIKKYLPVPGLGQARFLSEDDKRLVLEAHVTI